MQGNIIKLVNIAKETPQLITPFQQHEPTKVFSPGKAVEAVSSRSQVQRPEQESTDPAGLPCTALRQTTKGKMTAGSRQVSQMGSPTDTEPPPLQ